MGYIFCSLIRKINEISLDLSGGFNTRMVLAILLNSGVDLNEISIFSYEDKLHVHEEDFEIALNISSKFDFKLNDKKLDNSGTIFTPKDSFSISIFQKIGFHKEFYANKNFLSNPRFSFTGTGGEMLRGSKYGADVWPDGIPCIILTNDIQVCSMIQESVDFKGFVDIIIAGDTKLMPKDTEKYAEEKQNAQIYGITEDIERIKKIGEVKKNMLKK